MTLAPDIESFRAPRPAGDAIRVRGLVQGVGFRPTVWRLARDCGLSGDVCNDAEGVLIHAYGAALARETFLRRLREEIPPLARIDALETEPMDAETLPADFSIAASNGGAVRTGVVADAATCEACVDDIADPANRRYRYAFTNCTHCGPRLSIVNAIPYDRANTSMQGFAMCDACRSEYETPDNRRFHAQPNACADCGPKLWLETAHGALSGPGTDPIDAVQHRLRSGLIVAIKGVGGIHLACDAANELAVSRLRRRKHRFDKPFALMARDTAMIARYCHVSEDEAALLESTAAPIVLLAARGRGGLAGSVAPAQRCYGFMLPYSPLHRLLMDGLESPIVLTSGNFSEEPQCTSNAAARRKLGGIADALLLNDRDIVNRLDDSVVRIIAGVPAILRRARGYAPAPLCLPDGFRHSAPILAFGGELKSTFCLLRDGEAILSQHLGDLENAPANAAYRETLSLYLRLFGHRPRTLAIDAHPDYLPAKLGREQAEADGLRLTVVQHHHAHIAACLADNGVAMDATPVLGIALDGLGYGDDGTLWGGEFLLADYRNAERLAALVSLPMPGGVQAVHQPWRMAYGHLRRLGDWSRLQALNAELPFFRWLRHKPLETLDGMLAAGFNCPVTSSCGRLFDAVAAVIGVCRAANYEGQAAIELEAAVDTAALGDAGYAFHFDADHDLPRLDPLPMWLELLRDLHEGVPQGTIAARFHSGLAAALAHTVGELAAVHGNAWQGRIALSGGVFQNVVLSEALTALLEGRGLTVYRHARVPANDGGLSLGQAVIAAARTIDAANREASTCA